MRGRCCVRQRPLARYHTTIKQVGAAACRAVFSLVSKVYYYLTDEQLQFYREQHERHLAGEPTMPPAEPVDVLTDEDKGSDPGVGARVAGSPVARRSTAMNIDELES